jgi:hypothetical protein
MRRVVMASAGQQSLRAETLLSEELARLHETHPDMAPATLAAVRSVLESLVTDDTLDPSIVAEAKGLLGALNRPLRQTRTDEHLGLRAARLRAA